MGKKKTVVNLNSEVYYKGTYWNDIERVREYMSENFTGNKKVWWTQDFKKRFANKPFNNALFLNCGDGRFEREFIDNNIVKNVTAFDISPDLIKKAKEKKNGRKIQYQVADVNKIEFKDNEFDIAVNIAGLHHVQYIDRFSRILAKAIEEDGILVNFDYIGPHRNQYPMHQWILTKVLNSLLTSNVKQELGYPHLPTMMTTDPTEAIHSDLIVESLERYFNMVEKHDTGGGIAYLLLTQNDKLNNLSKEELLINVERILKWDKYFTDVKLVPQLFSYFIAKPDKKSLNDNKKIAKYRAIEEEREQKARKMQGVYTLFDYLKIIYWTHGNNNRVYLVKEYIKNIVT